jgi:hypothetical protein
MLFRELFIEELKNRKDEFVRYAEDSSAARDHYAELLRKLAASDGAEIRARFAGEKNIGALPSAELDNLKTLTVEFGTEWSSHERSREWVMSVLQDRTTFAVDGSQIGPDKNISLPVAAIQVGWFENHHRFEGDYKKGARPVVLSPQDLVYINTERSSRETEVGLRRFEEEVKEACRFLREKAGWETRGEKMPLAFFDGTLMMSVTLPRSEIQLRYIAGVRELVLLSQDTRVPIVGYVDRSEACDVVKLLDNLDTKDAPPFAATVFDTHILPLKNWGDRTIFYYSRRQNLGEFYNEETGEDMVGFVYLQTTAGGGPARIDIPSWIYDAGMVNELIDTVRAECVIGMGYPYPLETADATAVISFSDREFFIRTLQKFANENGISFNISSKPVSKGRRR